jgi:hypothetical protein
MFSGKNNAGYQGNHSVSDFCQTAKEAARKLLPIFKKTSPLTNMAQRENRGRLAQNQYDLPYFCNRSRG